MQLLYAKYKSQSRKKLVGNPTQGELYNAVVDAIWYRVRVLDYCSFGNTVIFISLKNPVLPFVIIFFYWF